MPGEMHRIGGSSIDNLRLKPAETRLNPPGISILKCPTPNGAAQQMRAAFPNATRLHEAARIVGTTTEELIRAAGFDIIADPTPRFPNHHRLIHPNAAAGFTDDNLAELAKAFTDTFGH